MGKKVAGDAEEAKETEAVAKTTAMKGKAGKFAMRAYAKKKAEDDAADEAAAEDAGVRQKPGASMKRPAPAGGDDSSSKRKKPADEKEVLAARKTELNKTKVADLKELAKKKGLEKGTRDAMVKAILQQEKKEREAEKAV